MLTGNRSVVTVLKVVLFAVLTYVLLHQILQPDFGQEVSRFNARLQVAPLWYLLLAIALMPVNWLTEAVKWKWLLQTQVSISDLLKGVLAGITFGLVTPGRSGEFIGRVLYVKQMDSARVFYLSSLGGIAQTVVTLVAGTFFLAWWSGDQLYTGIAIGLTVVFLLLYFRFDVLSNLLRKIPLLAGYGWVLDNVHLPSPAMAIQVLLISFIRYCIYLLQYVLLGLYFGVSDSYITLFVYSGVLLVMQTFSPLLPLLDVSFRGVVALYVFASLTGDHLSVLCMVTGIWFINLVAPALMGYLFILRRTNYMHAVRG